MSYPQWLLPEPPAVEGPRRVVRKLGMVPAASKSASEKRRAQRLAHYHKHRDTINQRKREARKSA